MSDLIKIIILVLLLIFIEWNRKQSYRNGLADGKKIGEILGKDIAKTEFLNGKNNIKISAEKIEIDLKNRLSVDPDEMNISFE